MAFPFAGIRFPAVKASGLSPRSGIHGDRRNGGNPSLPFLKKASFPGKLLAGNSSYEPDSASMTVFASGKVLIPGGESDGLSSSADSIGNPEVAPDDVLQEPTGLHIEDEDKVEARWTPMSSEAMNDEIMNEGAKQSLHPPANQTIEKVVEEKPRFIPPPGTGQRIYEIDPSLEGHRAHLHYR
ncbi:1,4-alpha-glucan-branching enzyme 1, chloroplastic/amyloplastic isoform X2 [Elaeis guineensis]